MNEPDLNAIATECVLSAPDPRVAMLGQRGKRRLVELCAEELETEYELLAYSGRVDRREVKRRVMRRAREERLGALPMFLLWPILQYLIPIILRRLADYWEN